MTEIIDMNISNKLYNACETYSREYIWEQQDFIFYMSRSLNQHNPSIKVHLYMIMFCLKADALLCHAVRLNRRTAYIGTNALTVSMS